MLGLAEEKFFNAVLFDPTKVVFSAPAMRFHILRVLIIDLKFKDLEQTALTFVSCHMLLSGIVSSLICKILTRPCRA